MVTSMREIYTALLDTPTIYSHQVRELSMQYWDNSCTWPDLAYNAYGHIPNKGHCYIGRTGNGLLKIGISKTPLERMLTQELGPLLVILDCQPVHEKSLHLIFRRERVRHREMFGGPNVEAFVAAARVAADLPFRRYSTAREFLVRELACTDPEGATALRVEHEAKRVAETRERNDRLFRRKARLWFARQATRAA